MRYFVLFLWVLGSINGVADLEDNPDEYLKALKKRLEELGNPWIAGTTSVSHLSWEEKKRLCRTIPIEVGENIKLPPQLKRTPPVLAKLDWREYGGRNWMTFPKYQGFCGGCWAFAWVGAQEARINIKNEFPDRHLNLSEQYIISCSRYGNCSGGRYWDGLGNWVRQYGIPLGRCAPYIAFNDSDATTTPGCDTIYHDSFPGCDNKNEISLPFRINDWGELSDDPNTWKTALQNGPLVISIDSAGLEKSFFYYKGGNYRPVGLGRKLPYNHAVVLCGYDDDNNRWIIKNSWGEGWGDEGFGYIEYGYEGVYIGRAVWMDVNPVPNLVLHTDTLRGFPWLLGEELSYGLQLHAVVRDFQNVVVELKPDRDVIQIEGSPWRIGNLAKGDSVSNFGTTNFILKAVGGYPAQEVLCTLYFKADTGDEYLRYYALRPNVGLINEFYVKGVELAYGIAYDSKNKALWVSNFKDGGDNQIRKIDVSGTEPLTGEITPVGSVYGLNPTDTISGLSYDEKRHWLWANCFRGTRGKKIIAIDLEKETVIKELDSPCGYPTGIVYLNDTLYVVDRNWAMGQERIYKVSPQDGTGYGYFDVPVTYPSPQVRGLGARGLVYEPLANNGQGGFLLVVTHFWLISQNPPVGIIDSSRIYEIGLDGTLIANRVNDAIGRNPRAIERVPAWKRVGNNVVEYWVGGAGGWIWRVKGYYEYGVEEEVKKGREVSFRILSNPCINGVVYFKVKLPERSRVVVDVYNISGAKVATIYKKNLPRGEHIIDWDVRGVSNGVYFVQMKVKEKVVKEKLILLK